MQISVLILFGIARLLYLLHDGSDSVLDNSYFFGFDWNGHCSKYWTCTGTNSIPDKIGPSRLPVHNFCYDRRIKNRSLPRAQNKISLCFFRWLWGLAYTLYLYIIATLVQWVTFRTHAIKLVAFFAHIKCRSYIFSIQLWNLAVLLILTYSYSFSWWTSFV